MRRVPCVLVTPPPRAGDGAQTLRGFWMTRWNEHASAKEREQMLDELYGLVRNGSLKAR